MLTVTLISLLCTRMVFSAVPSTFDVETNVGGVNIGWIEIFSCRRPEMSSGSTQTFANGKTAADYFQYFDDAIAVQFLPINTKPNDYNFDSPTNTFAVMTGVCSVPVVALNNNLDLSWPIDPNTLTNPGITADISYINNNYLGTDTARSRYVQNPVGGLCTTTCAPRNPTKIFDSTHPDPDYFMYWACCNHGGVHLTRDQCSLDFQDDLPDFDGITVFLGFDSNRISKCCVVNTGAEVSTQLCADPPICPTADADTFDWHTLTRDGTNIPVVTVEMDVDPLDLSLNINVIVEYIVTSSDSDQEIQDLGTTYSLDFEDFDAHKSKISEPNTCSNRLQSVYDGLTTDNLFEITSDKFDAIGTSENMCYPPPGGATTGWEIIKEESDCNAITYRGKWQWRELRECRNNGNNARQTEVSETTDYIELSGVFYVNMVSPFWNVNNDLYRNYYRIYQLISQPFLIQVSKSVYVIGSTGINVMTMSIVAVYKEDLDTDYTLILLTETAEYMMLQSPVLIPGNYPTDEGQTNVEFTLEMQSAADTGSTNEDCLNPKSYICSQMWKVYATDTTCTNLQDGIDFSGTYRIKFDPHCRTGTGDGDYEFETVCNTWLDDHPDFDTGVQLQSELTFVDKICKIRTFQIQLEADMIFYQEEDFQTAIIAANDNEDYLFQAGESMVYGEIVTRFPSDSESIFGSELVNVWLCTFPPETVPDSPNENNIQDYKNNNNVGCFSSNRDGGDSDNFFFHVYDSQNTDQPEDFEVVENGEVENNRIRFKFKVPRKIQRDTLYVHAQVQVTLEQETARRRVLLDVSLSHGPISNKIAHFVKNIGITNQPYKKPEPELPPQQPQYPQAPPAQPFTIPLNSTWIIIIGGLLSIILTFNIIFMCYMNCCKGRNGRRPRVSFNKNRRSGYDSVKHIDSEEFDDSEANLINVN